jgi:hypothetical protein
MQYSKIIFAAVTLMLAVSGGIVSISAQTQPRTMTGPLAITLYRPVDCEPFSCGQSGVVSCNLYDQTPPSGTGKTDCKTPWVNVFVHP